MINKVQVYDFYLILLVRKMENLKHNIKKNEAFIYFLKL